MANGRWKKVEDFLIRYRILISIIVFGALLIEDWNERLVPQNILDLGNPLSLLALVFVVSGIALRSWAAGVIRKTKTLATTGPYALTRHPLYVGSLFLGVGFSLIVWDNENLWALLILAAVLYIPKIRQEEKHLADKFPNEWAAYCKATGRFYPKSKPNLDASWSWAQWSYNREYNALVTSLGLLVVLACISLAVGASLS